MTPNPTGYFHIANGHRTRRARKLAAGQIEMWEGDDADA